MTRTRDEADAAPGEIGRVARGAAVVLAGSAISALLGFAFVIVLGRTLGADGAGVVLQMVGIFTIALSLGTLGLDTTAIWLLPRLKHEDPSQVRPALVTMIVLSFAWASLLVLIWYASRLVLGGEGSSPVHESVDVAAPFLVAAVLMTVFIAGTRALGSVYPFAVVDRTTVPALRIVLLVAGALGSSTLAVTIAWSLPWLVGAVAGAVLLLLAVKRGSVPGRSLVPDRALVRRITQFSLPRTVSNGLDQTLVWADVIVVGALAGAAAAGVYGAAARFVFAGFIVVTALRVAVGPRFSALVASGERRTLSELYAATAGWALLLGGPVYVTLAFFSPVVLSWLGDDFAEAKAPMAMLCVGALVLVGAGNIQTLLIMTGRSGLVMANKAVVVAFNLLANLALVPLWGIKGAALAWVASMVLDTVLAAVQVRRTTGVRFPWGAMLRVLTAIAVCVALPQALVVATWGATPAGLVAGVVLGGAAFGAYVLFDRAHLRIDQLRKRG